MILLHATEYDINVSLKFSHNPTKRLHHISQKTLFPEGPAGFSVTKQDGTMEPNIVINDNVLKINFTHLLHTHEDCLIFINHNAAYTPLEFIPMQCNKDFGTIGAVTAEIINNANELFIDKRFINDLCYWILEQKAYITIIYNTSHQLLSFQCLLKLNNKLYVMTLSISYIYNNIRCNYEPLHTQTSTVYNYLINAIPHTVVTKSPDSFSIVRFEIIDNKIQFLLSHIKANIITNINF